MKVLVSFLSTTNYENFEGVRLRKTIKGALEVAGVSYTSNPVDYYDVVHIMSSVDTKMISAALETNHTVVISALYCESDPSASFNEYKRNKDGNISINLSSKALKSLNKATLVLAPTESAKEYLIAQGVTRDIEVVSSGVNLSRFDFSRLDEKEIFYRYYREDKNKKLVIALGDYSAMDGVNAFINTAKKCPNAIFYYFGPTTRGLSFKIKRVLKNAPKNVKFKTIPTDDIYRSALINADVFMYPGYSTIGYVSLLEAMAAKCQLIIREQPLFKDLVVDGVNAHIGAYSETLTSICKDYLEGKINSTVEQAYKDVQEYSLQNVGEKLKWFYQQSLNIK